MLKQRTLLTDDLPYHRDLPAITEASAAAEPTPLDFDQQRPPRLGRVICAVCRTSVRIPILSDGKICDVCRTDLALCERTIASDLAVAEQAYAATIDAVMEASRTASERDALRYNMAVEARRTGMLDGKRYTEAAILASWQKYAAGTDTFAALLRAHDARTATEAALTQAQAWASVAREEIAAAKR